MLSHVDVSLSGLPVSCKRDVIEEFERFDLQLYESVCSGGTRDFRNRHGWIRHNGVSEPFEKNCFLPLCRWSCATAFIEDISRLTTSTSNSAA